MDNENLPIITRKFNFDIESKYKKEILKNLILAIIFILYLMLINVLSKYVDKNQLIYASKIVASIFMVFAIFSLEKAYKQNSYINGLNGVEDMIFSFIVLQVTYDFEYFQNNFYNRIALISITLTTYYILKVCIIYFFGTKHKLDSYSDIKEILKDGPEKKEATKQSVKEEIRKREEEKIKNQSQNNKNKSKKNKKENINDVKSRIKTALEQDELLIKNQNEVKNSPKKRGRKKKEDSNSSNENINIDFERYTRIDKKKSVLDQKMKPQNKTKTNKKTNPKTNTDTNKKTNPKTNTKTNKEKDIRNQPKKDKN